MSSRVQFSSCWCRRGQSVVELAITLPILLLVMLGIINLGLFVSAQIIVTNAAWEGARAGATLQDPDSGDAEILGAVRSSAGGLQPGRLVVDIDPEQMEAPRDQPWPMPRGQPLTVTVEYPLTLYLPMEVTLPVRARAVSRMEYQNP